MRFLRNVAENLRTLTLKKQTTEVMFGIPAAITAPAMNAISLKLFDYLRFFADELRRPDDGHAVQRAHPDGKQKTEQQNDLAVVRLVSWCAESSDFTKCLHI